MKRKSLNEHGLGALADSTQISNAKTTLSTLAELTEEVFSEAGFSEMPLGYYRG